MGKPGYRIFMLSITVLILLAAPVPAYEILLDIDTDSDPATINATTDDDSAVVKIILRPTMAGEAIGAVAFGLGGECLPCPPTDINGVQTYGVSFDLPLEGPWVTAPGFDSEAAYATHLGCFDNPGYHLLLSFEPQGGGTVTLNEPIFLAEFTARVDESVPEGCAQPSSCLMTMPAQGEWWSYILLGGAEPPNAIEACTWGRIKNIHR